MNSPFALAVVGALMALGACQQTACARELGERPRHEDRRADRQDDRRGNEPGDDRRNHGGNEPGDDHGRD